jgi:hypothetical protein
MSSHLMHKQYLLCWWTGTLLAVSMEVLTLTLRRLERLTSMRLRLSLCNVLVRGLSVILHKTSLCSISRLSFSDGSPGSFWSSNKLGGCNWGGTAQILESEDKLLGHGIAQSRFRPCKATNSVDLWLACSKSFHIYSSCCTYVNTTG